MLLYLLRHGEAEPYRTDDQSRELTEAGRQQIRRAARYLSQTPFNRILHSPLVRARQSAELIHEQIPSALLTATEYLTPTSDHRQLFRQLDTFKNEEHLLCVGHEPFLSSFIALVVTGSRYGAHYTVGTGTLACLSVKTPLEAGEGKLLWILRNDLLDRAPGEGPPEPGGDSTR